MLNFFFWLENTDALFSHSTRRTQRERVIAVVVVAHTTHTDAQPALALGHTLKQTNRQLNEIRTCEPESAPSHRINDDETKTLPVNRSVVVARW